MPAIDLNYVITWWKILFLVGIIFFPTTVLLFHRFLDKGYIFSKILGMLIISYLVFVGATMRIISFNVINFYLVLLGVFFITLFIAISSHKNREIFLHAISPAKISFFVIEEIFFFICLLFWSFVRGFAPDIHGLEKFMDYGFVNSILRSTYFPPKDMWFTPDSINYYYFGHLVTAVLTKLSTIPSNITYNLMIATLFAFSFVCAFSLAINLLNQFFEERTEENNKFIKILQIVSIATGGIFTAVLLSLGGNLHTVYTFFKPYSPDHVVPFWQLPFSPHTFPNNYWYPNATRFIFNTIHEFPIYSFVVSDLHGHVLGIPIILTIVAILLHSFIEKRLNSLIIVLLGFLIACAYMTNAWDGLTYLLLISLVTCGIYDARLSLKNIIATLQKPIIVIMSVFISFVIFSLPFSLFFKPPVSGIGILCAPDFLTTIGKIGPFLFEPNHCQKSPLWQLGILYGFFYMWVIIFGLILLRSKKIYKSDIFVGILITISTLLIIIPEFIYFKDIYPAHYRANTMFKLVYEAFMLLSVATGYIILRSSKSMRIILFPLAIVGLYCISFVFMYPFFAINSYYGNLKTYQGLDGTAYLKTLYPSDYAAISWINKNINGQPVILEAQGDSYTDFGRISVNTGLPTILGWTVHEWLWRGSYDIPAPRISEVQQLYESPDISLTKNLLKHYNVRYVFIGSLERQKYALSEDKFDNLGKAVYSSNDTKIYKIY